MNVAEERSINAPAVATNAGETDTQRVYWIRIPIRPFGVRSYLLFIAVSVSFSLLAFSVVIFLVWWFRLPSRWTTWTVVPIFFTTTWLVRPWLNRLRHRREVKKYRGRTNRLERVLAHPDSRTRLPHRHVEYALRQRPTSHRRMRDMVSYLKPGTVVVAVVRQYEQEIVSPPPSDHRFEPIPTLGKDERREELVRDIFASAGYVSVEEHDKSTTAPRRKKVTRQSLHMFARSWLLRLLYLYFFARLVVKAVLGNTSARLILGSLILFLVILYFYRLVMKHKWWIIPGAIVLHEQSVWSRKSVVKKFTRHNSPLLIYLPGQMGAVQDSEGPRALALPIGSGFLAMATWLGNAPTPPEENLIGLFTGESS